MEKSLSMELLSLLCKDLTNWAKIGETIIRRWAAEQLPETWWFLHFAQVAIHANLAIKRYFKLPSFDDLPHVTCLPIPSNVAFVINGITAESVYEKRPAYEHSWWMKCMDIELLCGRRHRPRKTEATDEMTIVSRYRRVSDWKSAMQKRMEVARANQSASVMWSLDMI